jgi:hypothetical protein
MMGEWRKLHNEELHDLYCSPSVIRIIKSRRLLVGKLEGKRPLGIPRLRWVDNVKMDRGEIGRGGVDCIGLDQDKDKWRALVNVVINLLVP